MIRFLLWVAVFTLCCCGILTAQTSQSADIQAIIDAQFGTQFELIAGFPVLTGDFNGDGSEDAAFVVTSHTGVQIGTDRYRVLDPSSEYFGLADASITSQFATAMPGGPRYLLIIHGNGKEGWHAKETKERFVVINLSFDHLSVGHVLKKKKVFDDISVEETGVLSSFLYWNGHRYKWQPGAANL